MSKSIENLLDQLTSDESVPVWATAVISSIKLIFEQHESANQELIRRIELLESQNQTVPFIHIWIKINPFNRIYIRIQYMTG